MAVDMIVAYCKKLKYKKKIVLSTNAMGDIGSEDLDEIAKKLKDENIQLVIL